MAALYKRRTICRTLIEYGASVTRQDTEVCGFTFNNHFNSFWIFSKHSYKTFATVVLQHCLIYHFRIFFFFFNFPAKLEHSGILWAQSYAFFGNSFTSANIEPSISPIAFPSQVASYSNKTFCFSASEAIKQIQFYFSSKDQGPTPIGGRYVN